MPYSPARHSTKRHYSIRPEWQSSGLLIRWSADAGHPIDVTATARPVSKPYGIPVGAQPGPPHRATLTPHPCLFVLLSAPPRAHADAVLAQWCTDRPRHRPRDRNCAGDAHFWPPAIACAGRRGTRQVRRRYPSGPSEVSGNRSGRVNRSGRATTGRAVQAGVPALLGVVRGMKPLRCLLARLQREVMPIPVHRNECRSRRRILRACRTREVASDRRVEPRKAASPGRMTTATGGASGSVNRWLRPDSVRHMSVTTAMQRLTVAHHDTQRDSTKTAREPGYAQATGRFRRWWQVLGSNQRRRMPAVLQTAPACPST